MRRRFVPYVNDRHGCSRRDPGPALAAFAAVVSACAFFGACWGVLHG